MNTIAFFDTKPYDKTSFDKYKANYGIEVKYFEPKLNPENAVLAKGCKAVVVFVNDNLKTETINALLENGVEAVALRCAGFNNVDLKTAEGKLRVFRVPAYSPYAVAEHAATLLMSINRKIHRSYNRMRDQDFSLAGLTGFDLYGKTVGVVGTGKIGQCFINICLGLGMKVLAYDLFPNPREGVTYVELDELFKQSDIISLHCPSTPDNYHLINKQSISKMKDGVYIINTSRGALVDAAALVSAVKNGKVGAAGLDVYEHESRFFFENMSQELVDDDILKLMLATPNIIITAHQAFLTEEALKNIAETTLTNLRDFFDDKPSDNELLFSKLP